MGYVGVRRGKVDIGVIFVVDATPFAVGVVGSGEFLEITCTPGIDPDHEDGEDQCEEDDNAAKVSAVSLFDLVRSALPGRIGSFLRSLLIIWIKNNKPNKPCFIDLPQL